LYGSLRAVNILLVPALHIDRARSANGLAPKTSRAGNSLPAIKPGDMQKHVQQKIENFVQAKPKRENQRYFGQHRPSATSGIPFTGVVFLPRDS
jgi:hypothetical protein